MPLNYEQGELTSFGPHYHVVPTAKWVYTPLWKRAHDEAMRAMEKTVTQQRMAQILPIFAPANFPPESVLCQEFRREDESAVVFFFAAKLGRKEFYHTVPILLGPKERAHFVLAGMWKVEPSSDGRRAAKLKTLEPPQRLLVEA